ncbi:hypothetical protein RB195_009331 [Necator americanus]|uniref:Uncharacterized protein n=1 Tax=Necator americanus TaxID=51031 RepID=A0ABR1CSV5_NECAM
MLQGVPSSISEGLCSKSSDTDTSPCLSIKRTISKETQQCNANKRFPWKIVNAKHRIPCSECFPFYSIQLGCFYVSTAPVIFPMRSTKQKINSIYICRYFASIRYCINTQRECKRYVSTVSVPFDLINAIYAKDHDLFIRLNSSALSHSCFCNSELVDFDVTQGERANSLIHHIVLRTPATSFCAKLLDVNTAYFSKLLKPFTVFFEDLIGATSPEKLRYQARMIVCRNSRRPPISPRTWEPYDIFRKKHPNTRKPVNSQYVREVKFPSSPKTPPPATASLSVAKDGEILSSRYSLPQIPDEACDAGTPALKTASFHSRDISDDFTDVVYGFGTTHEPLEVGQDILTGLQPCMSSVDLSEITSFPSYVLDGEGAYKQDFYECNTAQAPQQFSNLTGIPLAEQEGEEENGISTVTQVAVDSSPTENGVPPLYSLAEYRSSEQELDNSLPACTDQTDLGQNHHPFSSDDSSLYFLPLDDLSQADFMDVAELSWNNFS